MFDTGPFTDEAVKYLTNRVPLERLSYLFITHCHTDHYGLLHYIKQNSPARAFIPRYDMLKLTHKRKRLDLISKILFIEGFTVDVIEAFQTTLYRFESSLPLPDAEILEIIPSFYSILIFRIFHALAIPRVMSCTFMIILQYLGCDT